MHHRECTSLPGMHILIGNGVVPHREWICASHSALECPASRRAFAKSSGVKSMHSSLTLVFIYRIYYIFTFIRFSFTLLHFKFKSV